MKTERLAAFLGVTLLALLAPTGSRPVSASEPEYRSPERVQRDLQELVSRHPDLLASEVLARTKGGREVSLITAHLSGDVPPERRPAVIVVANLEGNLVYATELVVRMVEEIARRRGEPELRATLERHVLYFVPQANPDGAARYFRSPRHEDGRNQRPVDSDRDARLDEDGPEDLDGDGEILHLRVPDPRGDLCADPLDPRLLRPWTPDDGLVPRFRVIEEGIDNDADGAFNEDPPGGVHVAHNFPHRYSGSAAGAGIYPTSEIEAKSILDFLLAHPNVAVAITYGEHDNLRKEPESRDGPPSKDDEVRVWEDDREVYERIGAAYRRIAGLEKRATDTVPAGGSLPETLYFDFGLLSLAVSLFGGQEPPAAPEERAPTEEARSSEDGEDSSRSEEHAWLEWNDRALEGGGFVAWRPLQHPQLGEVAVGGWRPFVRTNLPPAQLTPLVSSQVDFVFDVAGKLPRLAITGVRVKDLGAGVFEVRAAIANHGEIPTALVQGTFTRRRTPLNVELSGDGLRVLGSRARRVLDRLEGRQVSEELRWMVQGAGGSEVSLHVRFRSIDLAAVRIRLVPGRRL